ncbi:hypothetical protein CLI64_14160 [Nostoc sp. CENA543]|uniref:hypothetical protein n=1 Tax=Nostoc sp. CENA543 TaxID=1869241 RepID=UPI000CA0D287|nr:hypothetical protein [Nostoc sp. CENA543]AUT01442.1 hypothetical protein CLI64_14160 [Nostoc sp. CENA543]
MKKTVASNKQPISLPLALLPANLNTAIVPLQPPQDTISTWERLNTLVQNINQIAAELEAKILELKAIASNINSQINSQINYSTASSQQSYQSICQYSSVSIPWVRQKPDYSFLLTTRKIDLFKAEREAALLAQQLRQRAHRKKLGKQRRRK